MGKVLPFILIAVGLGSGVVSGLAMRPSHDDPPLDNMTDGQDTLSDKGETDLEIPGKEPENPGYVKINNQFVVPVIDGDRVVSLVVLSVSIETEEEFTESVYSREPKLRDAFLQVLFDHAYIGGFTGVYTSSNLMDTLKKNLLLSAQEIVGENVTSVLITDILRQDL